ncbi:MAG: hypothetical protein CHACPFDD_00867 [Phycisphaerae bacterium]|nr:hypothetical protein [Phycisphaerae bacterium]
MRQWLTPRCRARLRVDHGRPSGGVSARALRTAATSSSAGTVGGRPERGSSCKIAGRPPSRYRCRHRATVCGSVFRTAAMRSLDRPSAARSRMPARRPIRARGPCSRSRSRSRFRSRVVRDIGSAGCISPRMPHNAAQTQPSCCSRLNQPDLPTATPRRGTFAVPSRVPSMAKSFGRRRLLSHNSPPPNGHSQHPQRCCNLH